MQTVLHFVLFEHATGFSLFRVKEFDEITRKFSAHPNAFLKSIAFIHFKSLEEALENVQTVSDGIVSDLLREFLRNNVPPKDSVLGVGDESLGKAIKACEFGFECVWHGAVREILRVIRQNFHRLTKSLITQPGDASSLALGGFRVGAKTSAEEVAPARVAESRARLVVGLARARLQLDLTQHLADTAVIKALNIIDALDTNLAKSASRLRSCYAIHFPEICWPSQNFPYLSDVKLIHLIATCPSRTDILAKNDMTEEVFTCDLFNQIQKAAQDSIGSDLSDEDQEYFRKFSDSLLKLIQMRKHYVDLLSQRVKNLVPNLDSLLNSTLRQTFDGCPENLKIGDSLSAALVTARLLANAGSLSRLANMPSSRILSLGASKALFRKSGAVAATSTGLLSSVAQTNLVPSNADLSTEPNETLTPSASAVSPAELKSLSANRIDPNKVRRRAARLLASKSALACRADCFRDHNPARSEPPPTRVAEDDPLKRGAFGVKLGEEVQHQLRVWAEANGIHIERTPDQIQAQRAYRKKYRKGKRKAWLARKLSLATTGVPTSTKDSVGVSRNKSLELTDGPAILDAKVDEKMMVDEPESPSESESNSSSDGLSPRQEVPIKYSRSAEKKGADRKSKHLISMEA
ncbi:unnamed protein product [Calicophoron daubneyi]|uniref:Nucleolar protein 56 n=1 Tax=Calicophoron daubneyi TaxID=300641 RepID=A0AAV2THY2_CALDB